MKKTMTLVETMVVVFIFSTIIASIFSFLIQSHKSFKLGLNKLHAQQEARKAIIHLHRFLRQSAPELVVNNASYPMTISENNKRINFYIPVISSNTTVRKIIFKLNPENLQQLLKKEGLFKQQIIANNITNLYFGGGCNNCVSFDCATVSGSCPMVNVNITTKINEIEYSLSSKIYLRNKNTTFTNITVEEIPDEEEIF